MSTTDRGLEHGKPHLTHYDLGAEAHGEGIPHDACPFSVHIFKREWQQGWRDAEQSERAARCAE